MDLELVDPGGAERSRTHRSHSPVEVQGAEIGEQARVGDRIEGGFERASITTAGAPPCRASDADRCGGCHTRTARAVLYPSAS
ncbi:MAG: hypothetical protein ACRDWD_06590, partial [Acidimicrobiia bacterium]